MECKKNAIGYVRVSTEGQAGDDKYGIDAQKAAILMYADENGYSIVKWAIDEASGAKDDRPALNEILSNTYNPPIQAVIVFKNDRLARDTKLYFYYLYTLEKRNIKLLSTQEEFVEGNDFANIYRALLQFVAEQERKNIALRTGRGRSMKAQCGGYSGGKPPYGYKVSNGQLIIDEAEAEIVKIVFQQQKEGYVLQQTVDWLIEHGYKTRKGRNFSPAHIRCIRMNKPVYQGMYKYGDMVEYVQGVHEPILPNDD